MTPETAPQIAARSPLRPVVPDVLLQHLEEHGFLCLQRRRLIFSTEYPLRRLPSHDERIEAHWDGMRVAGAEAVRLSEEKLGGEEPWEIMTAARVWIEMGRPNVNAVLERLAAVPPEMAPPWREALRGLPGDRVRELLPASRIGSLPAPALAIAVDALGWSALLPEIVAQPALRHADAGVRGALARVLAYAGLAEAVAMLGPLVEDTDVGVRRRALWSAALIAPEAALERVRRAARGTTPDAFAVRILGLLGEPDDHGVLVGAAATDTGRPAAFWALADLGTPDAVESLLRLLALPDEAPRAIAGAALEIALGEIPRKDRESPPAPEDARRRWEQVEASLPRGARVLAGQDRALNHEKPEPPMFAHWRAAVAGRRTPARWLRREVPDGFFTGLPAEPVIAGE